MSALNKCENLHRLVELDLSDCNIEKNGIERLGQWKFNLGYLNLNNNNIGKDELNALIKCENLKNLKHINVQITMEEEESKQNLRILLNNNLKGLTDLDLSFNLKEQHLFLKYWIFPICCLWT